MLFYSLLIVLSSGLFVPAFYIQSHGLITSYVEASAVESINQTAKNIEYIMNTTERISAYISVTEIIQKLMVEAEDSAQKDNSFKDINSYMLQEGFLKKGIKYIDLYGDDWEKVYSTEPENIFSGNIDSSLIANFRPSTFYKQWLRLKKGTLKDYTISFVRKARYGVTDENNFSVIGYVDLGVDENFIEQKYNKLHLGENSRVFIIDQEGMILSSLDKTWIGKNMEEQFFGLYQKNMPASSVVSVEGEKAFMLTAPIKTLGWQLVTVISQKEFSSEYIKVLTSNVYVLFIIFLLIFEMISAFSYHITKPLYILKRSIGEVRVGNLNVELDYGRKDEFGAICDSFKDLLGRLNGLFNEIYEGKLREKDLENRKKEVELICLQQQINPHFLYNTFTSIKFLIKMGRTEEAAEMVTLVGSLFRSGVYRGKIMVPVEEELEHVRAYVAIQQIRYREKLQVTWQINPDALKCKTLKYILQPIVENAICHGVEVRETPECITIKALIKDNLLYFEISDDGPGIQLDQLVAIRDQLKGKRLSIGVGGTDTGGIGLKNVNERIKMYFGESYGLNIDSTMGKGTLISIMLPIQQDGCIIGQ